MSGRIVDFSENGLLKSDINMIDCDPNFAFFYLGQDMSSKEAMIKGASDFMDFTCTDTEVTDIAFAVFGQTSFVKCETMGWMYEKTLDDVEAFIGALAPEKRASRGIYRRYPEQREAFEKYGIDWAQIAIDEARKRDVRPWLYFRMNDLHHVDFDTSLLHDPFFFKARENGWLNGNTEYGRPAGTSGRIENLYDFSHAGVREWMLTYIEEIMMRYDVYGYGLDFMRNIYCFDYLRAEPGYQEYMNDFMRRVRDIANRAGEKHGHKINLIACVSHTIDDNFVYGFDVKTWAEEGLVDAISARCEEVCNSGVDVKAWKDVLGDKIAFLVGFDDHISRWADAGAEYIYQITPEQLKGFCAKYFNLGVNGFYYNNFYSPRQVRFAKDMGRKTVGEGKRTFVVTHQDIVPIGRERYKPLPFALGEKVNFCMNIGTVKENERFCVTVGYDLSDFSGIKVLADGNYSSVAERIPIVFDKLAGHYYDEDGNLVESAALVRYEFDGFYPDGDFTVTFEGGEGINVVYLECTATPDVI